ncbi:MAG: ribosomal protein S18-alanine N-acetyltransferase [Ruminococcus sp.]|nr:ribosomal protein S18-alanine N-acetyltransferase [Ruminococcus sp.]
MELIKVTSGAGTEIFEKLSALDKKCVGNEGWSVNSFRSEVQKDNGIVLCFVDGDNIIALLSGYFAEGEGDITSVAVDENFRRMGLAQKLITEFIGNLPENTENIFLEVRENNVPAINLYRKCGFEKLSVRKNFYTNPAENAVVMVKNLDIHFPDKTILEVTFLNVTDFYSISFQNDNYTIVGGDKDIEGNLIGIADDDKVYYITTYDKKISYISVNIRTFIKQLLLFEEYADTNNPPENFRRKILESDADAFKSNDTFWSEICEELEYGII